MQKLPADSRMKRYASHRLYEASGRYQGQSVVTLDHDGTVVECAPLTSETPATEWLGGVIVLSGRATIQLDGSPQATFDCLFSGDEPKRYAWHISDFDFQQGKPLPGCIIRRL